MITQVTKFCFTNFITRSTNKSRLVFCFFDLFHLQLLSLLSSLKKNWFHAILIWVSWWWQFVKGIRILHKIIFFVVLHIKKGGKKWWIIANNTISSCLFLFQTSQGDMKNPLLTLDVGTHSLSSWLLAIVLGLLGHGSRGGGGGGGPVPPPVAAAAAAGRGTSRHSVAGRRRVRRIHNLEFKRHS